MKSKWISCAQRVSSLWEVCVRWTALCPRLTRKEPSSCPFATFLAGQKCHGSNQWKSQAQQLEHWSRRPESKAEHDGSKQGFCVSYYWTIMCKRGGEGLDPNALLENQNQMFSWNISIVLTFQLLPEQVPNWIAGEFINLSCVWVSHTGQMFILSSTMGLCYKIKVFLQMLQSLNTF